jgi:uncharacterized membrane protein HdeD (DUF308 family)
MATQRFESRLWLGFALRGIVAILFGVLAFARPGTTATALVYIFGAYVFLDGIFALLTAPRAAAMQGSWGAMMLVGIVGILVGVLTFAHPAATAVGLVYYVAVWAIVTGVIEVVAALRLRKVAEHEWLLAVAGLLSIAFGIFVAARPGTAMVSLVWIIGAYAIVFGALELGLAVRLHNLPRSPFATA